MILSNRVRTAAATAALTSAVAIAAAVTGSVHADSTFQPGRIDDLPPVPSPVHSPPGLGSRDEPETGRASSYVVAAGDSFWAIADRVLTDGAVNQDIARLTAELIALNAPQLGYDVSTMFIPATSSTCPRHQRHPDPTPCR